MGFGDDEEILQDFLVEAGEILELLSEQLVELEQRPDDKDLLNAIFRGFHTVKGGAGFLQLNAMVDCCHVTENLFDILRNGKRDVTPELTDVVLQALDAVNLQFEQIQNREDISAADPELILRLERLVAGEDEPVEDIAEAVHDETEIVSTEPASTQSSNEEQHESAISTDSILFDSPGGTESSESNAESADITDAEFERLLDAIDDEKSATSSPSVNRETGKSEATSIEASTSNSDEISDDEFDALLDQLHGSGKGPGNESSAPNAANSKASGAPSGGVAAGNEISEDEFDALLDQLHGQGKGPGKGADTIKTSASNPKAAPAAVAGKSGELIDDDEFDALLDQLHGQGKGPTALGSGAEKSPATAPGQPAEKSVGKKSAAKSTAKSLDKSKPTAKSTVNKATEKSPKSAARGAARDSAAPSPNVVVAETTVRVDTQRLDDIMNMVGELVLVRNRLVRLGDKANDEVLSKAVGNLDVVTADLQTSVMKTRMQPIKKVFGRFPRVVRDLARNLKKEINLELVGEDTDLDKNLVEALADPLVHLVRNSVDHGIEMPADREASGKPRVGKVILAAAQEGDHILLSITDDGAGMDPDKLRSIAVEKGLYDEDSVQRLSDVEAFNLIFAPGFSTKKEISDVSGRGVGMDVVKTKINQLNGSVEIKSVMGEGTCLTIKVPLTLAIMPTLMIMLEKQTFALPLASVNEIFHMDLTKTNIVDGQECVSIRDTAIPIFFLKRWLVKNPSDGDNPEESHVVIVSVGTQRVGFVVDQLIGQEEVVIKPLGQMLHGTPGMAGATITGDGTIALILDVPSMLKRYSGSA